MTGNDAEEWAHIYEAFTAQAGLTIHQTPTMYSRPEKLGPIMQDFFDLARRARAVVMVAAGLDETSDKAKYPAGPHLKDASQVADEIVTNLAALFVLVRESHAADVLNEKECEDIAYDIFQAFKGIREAEARVSLDASKSGPAED
jgi:hypothetical protein